METEPRFETDTDRENQNIAEFQYNRHLRSLGVTQVRTEETPEHRKMCYDFCVYEEGKWTAVLEVRSVNFTSDQIEGFGGFIIDEVKLGGLKKQFWMVSAVTGKGRWTKEVVFLFRCTKDDTLWAINIRTIVDNWNNLKEAPQEWMKRDHGEGQATKKGWQIPFRLLERVE